MTAEPAQSHTASPDPPSSSLEENALVSEPDTTDTYEPAPIDTSGVQLDDDILKLTEELAKNAHEVWAKERMDNGWTYGKKRDDGKREHPMLVAYDKLPDKEKEYDRKTALETLKVMLVLGYRIEKASERGLDTGPGSRR